MLKCLLTLNILFVSCLTRQEASSNECITTHYSDSTVHYSIIKKVVFDTTASLVHATVIDVQSRKLLSGAQMQLIRGDEKIQIRSNKEGMAQVFQDGIQGHWDISFSAPGYSCLTIKEFEIGGGQIISVRLQRS